MRLAPSVTNGINLGSTLHAMNRLEEAERVLRDALVLDPRSSEGKGLLALVLTGQDRYEEATRLAREIYEHNPDALSSHFVLACVLSEAGPLDEALEEANAAIQIAPNDPGPLSALGSVYLKMGDGARALAAFERMAECLDPTTKRLPSSGWLWCNSGRGASLSLLGRHDEAMAAFEEVLRTDAEFFETWPELAAPYRRSLQETDRADGRSRPGDSR